MYFDPISHQESLERMDNYEALKREILASEPENYLYQFRQACQQMILIEMDMKSLEFQCKEYAEFFQQLGKLIPKTMSTGYSPLT